MNDADLDSMIVCQVSDALIFSDMEGNIRRWNAAATSMFGYSVSEALGQSLDLIIPEKLRPAHWEGFNRAIDTNNLRLGGKPTLTKARHSSGSTVYVEMSFALVIDSQSRVLGAVAVAREMTGHDR